MNPMWIAIICLGSGCLLMMAGQWVAGKLKERSSREVSRALADIAKGQAQKLNVARKELVEKQVQEMVARAEARAKELANSNKTPAEIVNEILAKKKGNK